MNRVHLLFAFVFSVFLFCASDFALADTPPDPPKPTETEAKLAAALARQKELEAELEEMKKKGDKKPDGDGDDGDDLRKKAAKDKESKEDQAREIKRIESALQFNISVDDFVKKNADLLPKEISDIVTTAHKETYDSAAAKSNAIKSAIVQSYFSLQANTDALTKSQRDTLDDYLKLTKTGKEDKAPEIYANIFEPALETTRRVKKAEELARGRSGGANPSDADKAYKEKLIKGSRRQYLNEKEA